MNLTFGHLLLFLRQSWFNLFELAHQGENGVLRSWENPVSFEVTLQMFR